MNSNDIDDSKPDTLTASAPDAPSEAPAKPKRTRKAAAAAEPVTEASAEAPAEAAPKPRARRKTAAAEAPVEAAEAPADAAEAPAKPKRRTTRAKAADADAAPTDAAAHLPVAQVEVSPAPVSPVAEAVGELVAHEAPAEAGPAMGEGDGAAEGEREGRGRNRRRRGRDGREPREGQADQQGQQGQQARQPSGESDGAQGDDAQLQADAQERFDALISGEFDADVDGEAAATIDAADGADEDVAEEDAEASDQPAKRVLAPDADAPKLQKVLAQAGVGSRRDIEDMIAKGQITVNGEVAHVGQRISYGDRVAVAGKPIKVRIAPVAPRILAYHKPVGEVVTFNDPEGRPTVFRNLPRLPQGKWQSVGRLDLNTEGLLLFTNSGELANQLMHPRFGVEREYAVRVLGSLSKEQKDKLLTGVDVEGQQASFKSIVDGGGEGVNRWYRVVITEGRNREVRKLFETVGLAVSRLIRIRYGTVVLPRGLRRGVYIELGDADVRVIRQLAGNEPREQRADRNNRNERDKQRRRGNSGGPRPSRPEPSRNEQRGERFEHGDRPERGDRNERPARGDRNDRGDRQERNDQRVQQQQHQPRQQQDRERDRRRDDDDDDFIPKHINPLEQTFDRRFATGSKRIPQGFGRGGSDPSHNQNQGGGNKRGPGGERQPDPMKTSMGYIGADAFINRGNRGGRRGGGGGGQGGGGGGGGRGRR
ncbi:pseudouridine synthase [Roseateles chitosanitabidus]|uniref:pseudouridine synthase n=2 Tax=Roseateles chitosanitabidus TaxID=65048 RepID=UPI0009FE7E76|nr:pseudouridine synthase [Roseateles chitosanitabidus]